MPTQNSKKKPLYIVLISVHGLVRGDKLELGRDPDTGGQIKYVIELARALSRHPRVGQVDLLTRRIDDPELDPQYGEDIEPLDEKARIVRLDAGPGQYIPKESLWDYLDNFADNALDYLHANKLQPDVIHSHYADAGYVGIRIANLLGIPLVHTGHSLGRVKRRRLLASGMSAEAIEKRYNMSRRINAEEDVLANADLVITSTGNEIDEQYGLYDYYIPDKMAVVPPGTDLNRFQPPTGSETDSSIAQEINRFLRNTDKPLILALSRPDERKNIAALIKAYGESPRLQKLANLVIIAGNRDDIRDMEAGAQRVLGDMLLLVDEHDLYGKVAYPKHHNPDDVSIIYRLATLKKGVFINPALTEPFGLTLIEAAASGLPIVATEDGGPIEIIHNCSNGILIDPLDLDAIKDAVARILQDYELWRRYSENGINGVRRHYSWQAHADKYMEKVDALLEKAAHRIPAQATRRNMLYHDRAIFTDLDQNLLGDPGSLRDFIQFVRRNRKCASFGIATGRGLEAALQVMKRYAIPEPDVLITNVGTEIYYAPNLTIDTVWTQHIDHHWSPKGIHRVLDKLPGLKLQEKDYQSRYKISYYIDPTHAPTLDEINSLLHQEEISANTFLSFGQFLDVVPARASKGSALRYFAVQYEIPLEHILVAGGSGTDEDMMRGNTLGVVVANRHDEELSKLVDIERIYYAKQPFAKGILEAIDHYDFYGACKVP